MRGESTHLVRHTAGPTVRKLSGDDEFVCHAIFSVYVMRLTHCAVSCVYVPFRIGMSLGSRDKIHSPIGL